MTIIEVSLPFWGVFEVCATLDAYQYIEKAQEHSNREKPEQFSRFQTIAYLLLSVAVSFFHALSLGFRALGESSIYYFSNGKDASKEVFYTYGKTALKNLTFSVYQLFLIVGVLGCPNEVNKKLKLQKPLLLTPGLLSHDPEDITNQLMFQNQALRGQIELFKSQLPKEIEGVLDGFLRRNEEYDVRLQEVRLKARQELDYYEGLIKDKEHNAQEVERVLQQQKEQYESHIQKLHSKLKQEKQLWHYVKENLQGSWKELTGANILENFEYLKSRPHIVTNYFLYKR